MESHPVKPLLLTTFFSLCTLCLSAGGPSLFAAPPNVVVILTDDQGYADISLNPQHPKEVSTPHMDALARDGVVFSQGYTSGHVCSPTRAGIMLGGYQQRVGVYTAGDGGRGFDPKKPIFPAFLPKDYVSAAIGKWHLGLDDDFPELKWHAMNRGFDECYGFMGRGGHSYFDLRSDSPDIKFAHPMYRNKERINDKGYLTNRLTEEAVAFIDRNKQKPFFLYLAYNAVHAPAEAPAEDIKAFQAKFPGLSRDRAILMAMLKHLDDGVGDVVGKLKHEGLFENTIVFFLTDNGGAKGMNADNTPLRGFKSSLDEGGIRTPFIVSWPAKFSGGSVVNTPVISLDILPTALDALEHLPAENSFDGKSLLPLLTDRTKTHHDTLYWSKGPEDEWAVRRGNWKLHWKKGTLELVELGKDISETRNLAADHPAKVKELRRAFDQWIAAMAEPINGGQKCVDGTVPEVKKTLTERELERARIRAEKKKLREAERKAQKAKYVAAKNPSA
jgi:arylsulfatase A-like enzyme